MATNNYLFSKANDLRELVDLNDYLKSLYRDDGTMKFPSIVILGAQSDGKTSLIENITNLNLPRGVGIQTRVPTEIQLRTSSTPHYAIKYRPLGSPEYKVIDFTEDNLEEKMRRVQTEVTGSDNSVVDDLITLTIERPDLLPLTIIDLPGYIVQRINDDGNADTEIEAVMRSMYSKYIKNDQNLIVCCINATNDIETSSVFKLCLEGDPTHKRIILAVTKIDLRVSSGYEGYRKAAQKYGLRKLFFTRSKTDEERQKRINSDEVKEIERKFIASHSELKGYAPDQKGVPALREFLVEVQKEQILPTIRGNYRKLIDYLKEKRKEQEVNGKMIEKPKECKEFIERKIKDIEDELNHLYYDLNTKTESDNYYHKTHKAGEYSVNEVLISVKKITFQYEISACDEGIQIRFSQGVKEHIQVELLGTEKQRENVNVDLENPEVIKFPNVEFAISVRLLSDKDFIYFKETIDHIYDTFKKQYGLDYFLSEHFVQVYENHEKAINTTNNLPDRDFSQLAESILFKDLIPKLTYEITTFKDLAIKFAHQIFIVRINSQFKGFPNLRTILTKEVEKFFVKPVTKIHEIVEVLCENCFKTNTNDKMYVYKVEQLKKVFEEGQYSEDDDFLSHICGAHDYRALKETYGNNKKIFENAIRVWAYVSNIFPPLKDNVVKAIQNHLIQKPLKKLPNNLIKIFDKDFFENEQNVAKMMRPNINLLNKQKQLAEEIRKAIEGLTKIKSLPSKYPTLKKEFEFLDEREIDSIIGEPSN